MEAFTINTETQEIVITKAENGLEAMETEKLEQSTLHEKDIEAAVLLKKFGLKFADVSDKHRHLKVYNTQLTNNGFNYPGGKYELAPTVKQLMPSGINNFYDVCGGAGTMGVNISAKNIIHNEYDKYLFNLVKKLSTGTAEYNYKKVLETEKEYELDGMIPKKDMVITVLKKFKWSREPKHLTLTDYQKFSKTFCVKCLNRFKKRFELLRENFNNSKNKPWYKYFVMLVFSFDHTARYDTKGNFNNTFNDRKFSNSLRAKLLLFSKKLIENKDRYSFHSQSYIDLFEKIVFAENDFFYFDPPYYITNNEYTRRYWGEEKEIEFLQHLKELNDEVVNEQKVKFGLSNVIFHKGKANTMLIDFINDNKLYVHYLPKSYDGAAKTKSKEPTVEVFITNYPTLACPKFIKVPMEYDKSKCSTALIQELRYSSGFIQGRLVDADNMLENIVKHNALADKANNTAIKLNDEVLEVRLNEIKHREQIGINCLLLKAEHKGKKGAYGVALEKTGVSKSKAERYMKFVKNKRIMTLKDEELLNIPMLTYTKLVKMMKLDDDDFYKVVKGDLAILTNIAKEKASKTQANKNKANEVVETDTTITTETATEKEFVNPYNYAFSDSEYLEMDNNMDKDKVMELFAQYKLLTSTQESVNHSFPHYLVANKVS